MNTAVIVKHTERLDTLCLRLIRPSDQDTRRKELIASFELMATDCGKIATRFRHPDWARIYTAMAALRMEAVCADESRSATFAHAGAEMALVTSLHGFAATLGFILEDAATAANDIEDDEAMAHVESHREAAE
ncbi:MAG: hypothetical protein ACOH2M_03370 [Cypionkella sp.]